MDRTVTLGQHPTQRFVQVPLLQLDYELFGSAPVQALGTIAGREFYFRARHNKWDFEVSAVDGQLPTDTGADPVFFKNGEFANASYMPHDVAMALIERCAEEYLSGQD